VLWHVIHRIRRHWPKVRILIRGDSHYCAPEVLDLLRRLRCDYILSLAINPKLDALAKPWREQCEAAPPAGPRCAAATARLTFRLATNDDGSPLFHVGSLRSSFPAIRQVMALSVRVER
jgi:hypothetical protein